MKNRPSSFTAETEDRRVWIGRLCLQEMLLPWNNRLKERRYTNSNEQSETFNATENLKKWRKWRRRSCTTSDETRRRIMIFIHFPYNMSVLIIYWTAHIN
ncbi:hypothetical protein PENTCL1PPCAC_19926 [Pristionchus entomophagus]|uniref:Uncharacterized protein n=1 Tax=Pristionchus entomophagus TaxID=358040 RepID=A0AAV5TU16_9BILA|nr:hypothetical protein PENTCL1PPCAC_19926 [Pristionchus entomophagus]